MLPAVICFLFAVTFWRLFLYARPKQTPLLSLVASVPSAHCLTEQRTGRSIRPPSKLAYIVAARGLPFRAMALGSFWRIPRAKARSLLPGLYNRTKCVYTYSSCPCYDVLSWFPVKQSWKPLSLIDSKTKHLNSTVYKRKARCVHNIFSVFSLFKSAEASELFAQNAHLIRSARQWSIH